MIDFSVTTITDSLQPLGSLDPTKDIKKDESGLSEFAHLFAEASKPAIRAEGLQKAYMEGKPVNIDEMKIALAEEHIMTSFTIKAIEKIVHSIESTFSMQV